MRTVFHTVLLMAILAVSVAAQEKSIAPSNASDCTQELFDKAEESFQKRIYRTNLRFLAERQLREVVQVCNGLPEGIQAAEHLGILQEEMANSNLSIALFYLEGPRKSPARTAGALGRLKAIVERYPRYSKLDQVLYLLGEINRTVGNFDEATTYYQKIIRDHPGSQYFGDASIQLSVIDAMRLNYIVKPR